MSKESSFDIVSEFDFQELKNAVEQTKKEVATRYDLKGCDIEIELTEDKLTITAENNMQLQSVESILLQKMINRGVSPKILTPTEIAQVGGGRSQKAISLITALDTENAKKISALIRDSKIKVKASIQGDSVRVSGKSKDDLQEVMALLKEAKGIEVALQFTNYR
jgi:uncharacterized protein YajQ (UPF0234 family)